MASSSSQLAVAVALALLVGGAWCATPGTKIAFHVENGSSPNNLKLLVKDAAVDIVEVDVKEKGSNEFLPMKQSSGTIWTLDTPKPLKGPLSIRLTAKGGGMRVEDDVIPADWKAGTAYNSKLQFGG
ncbi:major pollen allergen Cyn d 1-like [Phragmites australis]|uniref:major pollen allergen Cyn d 1-like n=1 Tax=Phragmites australis TaxID=29695 RepID=UPI002D7907EF|nr:major pollen allergen Cyn d 1-like [Phragmites australis]XP_062209991.1 major pollen allergen Cyn d 1-like [Phragmites australis]